MVSKQQRSNPSMARNGKLGCWNTTAQRTRRHGCYHKRRWRHWSSSSSSRRKRRRRRMRKALVFLVVLVVLLLVVLLVILLLVGVRLQIQMRDHSVPLQECWKAVRTCMPRTEKEVRESLRLRHLNPFQPRDYRYRQCKYFKNYTNPPSSHAHARSCPHSNFYLSLLRTFLLRLPVRAAACFFVVVVCFFGIGLLLVHRSLPAHTAKARAHIIY